jgi:hypothetical protein
MHSPPGVQAHITNACAWNKAAAADRTGWASAEDAMRMLDEIPALLAETGDISLEDAECKVHATSRDNLLSQD